MFKIGKSLARTSLLYSKNSRYLALLVRPAFHKMFEARALINSPMQMKRCSLSTTPVSRKKKTTGTPVRTFLEEASAALLQIEEAVKPMIPLNKDFHVLRDVEEVDGQLVILTSRGPLIFKVDSEAEQIVFQSYLSGFHKYFFDSTETREWLSVKDGHDMRGLIARDLLRHCSGCPEFK